MITADVAWRAALAGWATGARTQSALGALARTRRPLRKWRAAVSTAAQLGEIVGDKLPVTPSRLDGPGLPARVGAGAFAGGTIARRGGANPVFGAAIGAAVAAVATHAGARGRAVLAARFGSDLPGAVLEDALAVGLAEVAARRA